MPLFCALQYLDSNRTALDQFIDQQRYIKLCFRRCLIFGCKTGETFFEQRENGWMKAPKIH